MSSETAKNRKITAISGWVLIGFTVYVLAFLIPDVIRTLGGPEAMTLTDTTSLVEPNNHYVSLSGYTLDCDSIRYAVGRDANNRLRETTRSTNIFASAENSTVLVIAQLSGRLECDEIDRDVLTGYLTEYSSYEVERLDRRGRLVRYPDVERAMKLCVFCGPDNSILGIIISSIMLMFGIGLVVLSRKLKVPESTA